MSKKPKYIAGIGTVQAVDPISNHNEILKVIPILEALLEGKRNKIEIITAIVERLGFELICPDCKEQI